MKKGHFRQALLECHEQEETAKKGRLGVESKVTLNSCTIFLASRRKCCNELQAAARLAFEQLPPIPSLLHSSFFALRSCLATCRRRRSFVYVNFMLAIRGTCAQISLRRTNPRAFIDEASVTYSSLAISSTVLSDHKRRHTRMSIISDCSAWT